MTIPPYINFMPYLYKILYLSIVANISCTYRPSFYNNVSSDMDVITNDCFANDRNFYPFISFS